MSLPLGTCDTRSLKMRIYSCNSSCFFCHVLKEKAMPCRKCGITDSETNKERLQKERERLKTLPLLAERHRPVSVQVQVQKRGQEKRSEWPPRTLNGVLLTAETRRKIWSIGRGGR
jgi:hypothetical protein